MDSEQLISFSSDITSLKPVGSKSCSPGPGSYKVSRNIGSPCVLSNKRSALRYSISKGEIERVNSLRRDSPPPNLYKPSAHLTFKRPRATGMGNDNSPRLSYIEKMKGRSPGPIYDVRNPRMKSTVFNRAERQKAALSIKGPAPGDYKIDRSFMYLRKNLGGKFLSGDRENYKKLGAAHSLKRGATGPGPIYEPKLPIIKQRVACLSMSGHADPSNTNYSPPVGTYNPEIPKKKNNIALGKAQRFM